MKGLEYFTVEVGLLVLVKPEGILSMRVLGYYVWFVFSYIYVFPSVEKSPEKIYKQETQL